MVVEGKPNMTEGGKYYENGRGKAPRVLSVNPVVRAALDKL